MADGNKGPENPEVWLEALKAQAKRTWFDTQEVEEQRGRVRRRAGINQFLDENEHEWNIFDSMCRARPWATNKDKPFPYPFRKAVKQMRDAGEKYWLGEDENLPVPYEPISTREAEASPCPIITQLRVSKVYPPIHRIVLFTPEFGDNTSYSVNDWYQIPDSSDVDIWTICWQGWVAFDEMFDEVLRWVLAFGDGVSTVWFGHSFGAIVAYECLKRCLDKHECPNLPVALFVSGCPAPHLVSKEFSLKQSHPFLANRMEVYSDYSRLSETEIKSMTRDFGMELAEGEEGRPMPNHVQRLTVLGDMRVMRTYKFRNDSSKQMPIPLFVFRHDEDTLVPEESSSDAWKEYSTEEFEVVSLEEHEDTEALAALGHGYVKKPLDTMLRVMHEKMVKYQINKNVDTHSNRSALPSVGDTTADLPTEVDCLIVGAGCTGACASRAYALNGFKPLVLEKTENPGGIWRYYANIYSRVNTSEVGYRLMDQTGTTARPNQDHSPTHDILRDIYTLYATYAYDRVRTGWEVKKCEKQPDNTYIVTAEKVSDKTVTRKIKTPIVQMCLNRRIGKRRDVVHEGQEHFRGDIAYGYGNEMRNLDFWGKRVIVVGAGAFAYENLRTALERGAKHCTILGRRAGTTSPKWIDIIAFLRPTDSGWNMLKSGNMISFQYWQDCFRDAGLPEPDAWKEGLLKPDNHTVSVSDLAYIGGFHGMVSLEVGEIKNFRKDGQGVTLTDGRDLDVDIVIKCTGFHLNQDVPKITGLNEMDPSTFLDYNLGYQAEPLLDGAQFGSAKGRILDDEQPHEAEAYVKANIQRFQNFPQDVQEMFMPRSNPFGSGYVGAMNSTMKYQAWLAANPEIYKQQWECLQSPDVKTPMATVKLWASTIGQKAMNQNLKLVAKYWGAQDGKQAPIMDNKQKEEVPDQGEIYTEH